MSLRQVKQVRRVRETMDELSLSPPNTWPDALTVVAQLAPERLTRELVEQVNHLL